MCAVNESLRAASRLHCGGEPNASTFKVCSDWGNNLTWVGAATNHPVAVKTQYIVKRL